MSFIDGLINKGKAKLKEFTDAHPPSQSQHQSYSNYPSQQAPPYGQYPGQQPQSYNYPPQQHQPYNFPPQNSPYNNQPPPVPLWNKPNSPPPIPTSSRPSLVPQSSNTQVAYWEPHFDPSVPVSEHFKHETGAHGWGNAESQNYTSNPQNSFFTSSNPSQLVIRAISSEPPLPDGKYTSARLVSHQKLSRQRGCISATVKAPCASGIWPAFWLLPADPFTWPNDGEVDIFESWNGDCVNHSCLHWGHFNGEDWNKHRVVETNIPSMPAKPIDVAFAWSQKEDRDGAGGKMIWYLDGQLVMKADIPPGTRRLSDYRIIINVAMGGNVCQGRLPADGWYDFVVSGLKMCEAPAGGWDGFEGDWARTKEGHAV